jgi:hypothetical protein
MGGALCVWRMAVCYSGADTTSLALFISGTVILQGELSNSKKTIAKLLHFNISIPSCFH